MMVFRNEGKKISWDIFRQQNLTPPLLKREREREREGICKTRKRVKDLLTSRVIDLLHSIVNHREGILSVTVNF